ncbi:MAG TPA: hypothetical protein VGC21_02940 [Telluria sp.]
MSPVKVNSAPAGATLVLALGAGRIDAGLLDAAAVWQEGSLSSVVLADGADIEALAAALRAMPALPACAALRVLVADCWLGAASLPWSATLGQPQAAQALARTRLQGAGFAIDARDTVRIDDAAFGAPRLVLAYPAPLMAALALLAGRLHARLESVSAFSVAAWSLARAAGASAPAALALLDDDMLLLCQARAGRLAELTVRRSPAGQAPLAALAQLWQRQCLREPQLAALTTLPLADLRGDSAQPAPAPAPFAPLALAGQGAGGALRLAGAARPRHRLDALALAPVWSSALAVPALVGVLLAGAALGYAVQHTRVAAQLQARVDRPAVRVASAPPAPQWDARELPRVTAVNVAVRELNLPFAAILRALQPPPDLRVAVLSVTTAPSASSAQASRVKIVAEARSGAEMARYVAFVAERKPFTGAYLSEHEIDESAPERPYRFTLEAAWTD